MRPRQTDRVAAILEGVRIQQRPARQGSPRLPSASRSLVLLALAMSLVAAAAPNDPLVPQQTHLETVRAFEAWDTRRGEGAVIAVLDTGIDLDHPDLLGRLVEGIDLVDPDSEPDDEQGHGTIVAGIIGANADNQRGTAGVAPQAMIMPIRVLDAQGRGESGLVADGIRHAIAEEVDVINLSLAEVEQQGVIGLSLVQNVDVRTAIEEADEAGILVVAAAGNSGRSSTPYAADSPVLVVGATTGATDEVWLDSNIDDRTIFAPGVDIYSTWGGARYARGDGTSFATPIVAAGAAMLMGAGLDHDTARQMLIDTSVDIEFGLGRIDLAAAVEGLPQASEPAPAPEPEPLEASSATPTPPVDPVPSAEPDRGLEAVEEVAALPTPTPVPEPTSRVTVAPPDIVDAASAAATPSAGAPASSARPVDADPSPSPTDLAAGEIQEQPGLSVDETDDGSSVTGMVRVATALLGADILLAGFVLLRHPAQRERLRIRRPD